LAAAYDVVVAGRRVERLAATAGRIGGTASTLVMDVTSQDSVDAAVATPRALRCAGQQRRRGRSAARVLPRARLTDWEEMYAANVIGTVRVIKAVLPLLRRSPHATIVNMSSTAGQLVYEGGAGYCAAKHGTSVISETLRLELVGEHIRVCDIRPGMVMTDEFSLTRFRGDAAEAASVYADVDRPLTADDVAACVEFVVGLPQHVNIDSLVVKPVAQAAQHKLHRGKIDWRGSD
jgi:NADP-dependent 3-hydroxy acid dehydrogenase YdfG